jgi:hypothetical protein
VTPSQAMVLEVSVMRAVVPVDGTEQSLRQAEACACCSGAVHRISADTARDVSGSFRADSSTRGRALGPERSGGRGLARSGPPSTIGGQTANK